MMNNSSRKFANIFVPFSKAAILLGILVIWLALAGSVMGQDKPAAAAGTADYKSSLNSLSTLYQNEIQRLEKRNSQSKDLFNQGLISRVELEISDKALADARAKVEDVARQIAEANKPALPALNNDLANLAPGNQAWSTGN